MMEGEVMRRVKDAYQSPTRARNRTRLDRSSPNDREVVEKNQVPEARDPIEPFCRAPIAIRVRRIQRCGVGPVLVVFHVRAGTVVTSPLISYVLDGKK